MGYSIANICACGIPAQGWIRRTDGKNYTDVDAAIVMDHLILAAASLGLGTCWIAAFDPTAAREVLGLPDGVDPIAFTRAAERDRFAAHLPSPHLFFDKITDCDCNVFTRMNSNLAGGW